jgi:hypothetical protein
MAGAASVMFSTPGRAAATTPSPMATAGMEAGASSSRSQVPARIASAAASLTLEAPSMDVCWRVPLVMAIVTHLVTRPVGVLTGTLAS